MKKTMSDYHPPFAKIKDMDLHYICSWKGYIWLCLVRNGKEWEIRISPKGNKVQVYKGDPHE